MRFGLRLRLLSRDEYATGIGLNAENRQSDEQESNPRRQAVVSRTRDLPLRPQAVVEFAYANERTPR
jgi:hypothetical protein